VCVAATLAGCSDTSSPTAAGPARTAPAPPDEEPRIESVWLEMPFQCRMETYDWARCRFERRGEGFALSFGRSGLVCGAVDFDDAGTPATLHDCRIEPASGITVPPTIALTESVWGILEGDTTGWTCAREYCSPGLFLRKDWPAGPFASIDAYCADVVGRCRRAPTLPGDCTCRVARSVSSEGETADVDGSTEVSTPRLAIQQATLLRVTRGISEPVSCELAIRTHRGVFVLQRASNCGRMRPSGRDRYELTARLFETWFQEDGAALLFDWEERVTFVGTSHRERFRIRCEVDESGIPRCPWRERRNDGESDLEHAAERWHEVPGAGSFVRRNARTVVLEARETGGGTSCGGTSCSETLHAWPLRGTLRSTHVVYHRRSDAPPASGCWDERLFTDWTAIEIAETARGVEPYCSIEATDAGDPTQWAILRVHEQTPP
jgi:hypothetical protein